MEESTKQASDMTHEAEVKSRLKRRKVLRAKLRRHQKLEIFFFKLTQTVTDIFRPLKAFGDDKSRSAFICWFLIAFIFGTFPFWMPLLSAWYLNKDVSVAFGEGILAKELLIFGIIILADGLGTAMSAMKTGKDDITAGIRGKIGVLALLVIVINIVLYSVTLPGIPVTKRIVATHLLCVFFSGIMAVFLYCLRNDSWENSAEQVVEGNKTDVARLSQDAKNTTKTNEGIAL